MITIKKTAHKGNGIFTDKSILKGEIVLIGKVEMELDYNHSHASQVSLIRFILPNETYRHTNHSCNPNCGIQLNEEGAHNLIAKKDIAKNEEITFDYAMENFTIGSFPSPCLCESENCRKEITGWKGLPEAKKIEYREWAAPYLLELESQLIPNV